MGAGPALTGRGGVAEEPGVGLLELLHKFSSVY